MPIYTKKRMLKDGTIKVYQYDKSSSEYSKRTYQKLKDNNPKVECDKCSKLCFPHYMEKHQKTAKCKKIAVDTINEQSKETPLINSTEINL